MNPETRTPPGEGGAGEARTVAGTASSIPQSAPWGNIPDALKALPQWLCWRYEDRKGKPTKVPYQARAGEHKASTSRPATWRDFATACEHASRFDGIGIAFAGRLCGVDLDHCRDPQTGKLESWAREALADLNSYTEASPSGTGLHVLLFGDLPPGRRKVGDVEAYGVGSPKYFTVTGAHIPGTPTTVEDRTEEFAAFHARHLGGEEPQADAPSPRTSAPVTLEDRDLLEKARSAKNGADFSRLWDGGYPEDDSAGDLALCSHLAFWTHGDRGRMDALFRQSGRYREKWERVDYRERTLGKALDGTTDFYTPGGRGAMQEQQADGSPDIQGTGHRTKRPTSWRCTELGMAERFRDVHAERLRWCPDMGKWLVWRGSRWEVDETGEAVRMIKQAVLAMYAEAGMIDDDKARDAFVKFIRACEKNNALKNILALAQSELPFPARIADFDFDGWLLNCENGTIDLRTGELRPHRPADLCLKQIPVAFDPAADCPLWLAFLDRAMAANQDMITFLQCAVGSCLPAHMLLQLLFILWGSGSNGKSVFISTILALLGDYGASAEPQTLLARKHDDNIRNDLAALAGKRLVTTSEIGAGKRMDEALVKRLTGSDKITARFLNHEFFSFDPTFRVWLATNHRPEIRETTHAVWRRIRLVPFNVTIPEGEQDPHLPAKLCDELPGILNWALTGCLAWQAEGRLNAPEDVRAATAAYREESDPLAQFIADCCVTDPEAWVRTTHLRAAYDTYCHNERERPLSAQALGRALTERGFVASKLSGAISVNRDRTWKGIGLKGEGR